MKNKIIPMVCGLIIAGGALCYAASSVENGVTVNREGSRSEFWLESTIYDDYNPGTSTVYNDSGGTSASDGWINIEETNDEITIGVNLDTLGSDGLDITVQGAIHDDKVDPFTIHSKSFAAADEDYVHTSTINAVKWIRVAMAATGTAGTDSCTVKLRAEGNMR